MSSTSSASEAQIREKIRAYLEENFLYMRRGFVLRDEDRLLERGVIDSIGVVELLTFIDEEFGVKPADNEVNEANLGTLKAIAHFVAAKKAAANGSPRTP